MDQPTAWHCLHLVVPQGAADEIAAYCHDLGSCGLEIEDEGDSARLAVYFAADLDRQTIHNQLDGCLQELGLSSPQIEAGRVEARDWAASWRRFFRPVWATARIVVHPPWIPVDIGPDQIDICIEPKMAFGTGGHESTQLCLQALQQVLRPGDCCLDLGTGSGVLAIAALRLGAGSVLALDVDPEAVANARENIVLNGLAEAAVEVRVGALERGPEKAFRLIVANIQSHVLKPLLSLLQRRLQVGGDIVFSGLLGREEETFAQAVAEAGLIPGAVYRKNEWIALAARRAD
ncbi:MAG: methyltransferase domain-containing protein [Candidatus Latescibacteria bacterium]|nr:methyltransferase domain-containing protein [Candidatus Latescibacterota bacterium]